MRANILIIMLLAVAATASASIILPHTFQNNSPALAQEINANFAALAEAVDTLVPVGAVLPFAGPSSAVPGGWLLCDGEQLDPNSYPDLYEAIGEAHGGSSGVAFRLPDYRGRFLRGVNGGTGRDPDSAARLAAAQGGNTGDAVGTLQLQQFQMHRHSTGGHQHAANANDGTHTHAVGSGNGNSFRQIRVNDDGEGSGNASVDGSFRADGDLRIYADEFPSNHGHIITTGLAQVLDPITGLYGTETRPVNMSVNYIIRCGAADAC